MPLSDLWNWKENTTHMTNLIGVAAASPYLVATGFGFNLSSNAVILGIEVGVKGYSKYTVPSFSALAVLASCGGGPQNSGEHEWMQ